jgi:TonB family protein
MTFPSLSNLVSVSLQMMAVAAAAALAASLLRVTAPGVRYGFWRLVLLLCLLLPWLQTPRQVATTESTPSGAAPAAVSSPGDDRIAGSLAAIDWVAVAAVVISIGIVARLVWIVVGGLKLRRLRAAGEPLAEQEHAVLQRRIGTHADVRYVAGVRQPMTFGVLRPVVLLPAALGRHPAATRDAVLAHELVHVRRADWCWVVVEELLRTLLWFHPAIWWLISRVQLAREEVVDAAAVAATGQRRAYLEAMLVFADDVPPAAVPAFARRRHLFRRIVLLSTEEVMSSRRIVLSAFAMAAVVAAAGWTAVRAFPIEDQVVAQSAGVGPLERIAKPITRENPMPRKTHDAAPVFPPEAAGESLNVTVTLRTVIDQAGLVGELRLNGLAFQMNGFAAALNGGPDTLTQLEGLRRAQFAGTPGGVAVSGETLLPLLQTFVDSSTAAVQQWRYELPQEAPIAFDTVVQFTTGRPVTTRQLRYNIVDPTAAGDTLSDGAVRIGGAVKPPPKLKDVRPLYPEDARDNRVQGVVIIEARIEGDGRVSATRLLRSIPMLDEAALDAVKQWEFQPTLLNGAPVPVVMTVTVQFTLQ